jgi:hypothetical protein
MDLTSTLGGVHFRRLGASAPGVVRGPGRRSSIYRCRTLLDIRTEILRAARRGVQRGQHAELQQSDLADHYRGDIRRSIRDTVRAKLPGCCAGDSPAPPPVTGPMALPALAGRQCRGRARAPHRSQRPVPTQTHRTRGGSSACRSISDSRSARRTSWPGRRTGRARGADKGVPRPEYLLPVPRTRAESALITDDVPLAHHSRPSTQPSRRPPSEPACRHWLRQASRYLPRAGRASIPRVPVRRTQHFRDGDSPVIDEAPHDGDDRAPSGQPLRRTCCGFSLAGQCL